MPRARNTYNSPVIPISIDFRLQTGLVLPKQSPHSSVSACVDRGKKVVQVLQTNIMGAKCSCSCFGSAMDTKASRMVLSESLCSKFKRRIKRKNKKRHSKPTPSSNYDVKISPHRVTSAKAEALVNNIVSISRDRELIPVILSPVGKAISNEGQPAKKKEPLGFDAEEIKVKSHDAADISVKSLESEVYTEELAPKQISGEEEEVTVRNLDRRSWVRIAKASRFAADLNYIRNEPKVSQNPNQGHHAKDVKTEQPKAQEIRQEKEIPDSIPRQINQLYSKSSDTSAEVESKSCKLLKSIDFHRKVSSHSSAPNSPSKRREIKSVPLFSSSSYSQLQRSNMATMRNSPTPNSQPKKLTVSASVAERKGTITGSSGDVTGEGEGYGSAINLWVLIIIMGCLVVFSDRILAVVCASVWWYLLPILLKKTRALNATDGVKIKRSVDTTQWRGRELNRSVSDVLPFCPSLE